MAIDIECELYEKIIENQSLWSSERKISRKIVGIHSINAVIALMSQMEVLTKKLDNQTQNVSIVHQPTPVCEG